MDYNVIERIEKVKALQIPDDLKKSQVGLIPKRWNIETLNSISLGPGKYGANASAVEYSEKLPTYLRITDIDENGRLRKNKLRSVNISDSENYKLKNGDLVFTRTGATTGKTYLYNVNDGELVYAGFLIKFSLDLKKVVPKFITAITKTDYYDSWVCVMSTRSGQPGINSKEYGELCLPIPPIEEQQKIAEILTTWDKAIELKEKLVEEKKKKKNGLMQRLLTGKVRLKGFKSEWKEVKLGNVLKERKETNFNELELLAITGKKGVVRRNQVNIKDNSNEDKSKYKRICKLDIGYNTMRMWQGVSGVSEYEGIVSPAYTILKPTEKVNSYFIGYLFKLPQIINLFWRNSQGLTGDTLNLKYPNLKVIRVKLPMNLEEQKAIANILITVDKEIEILTEELEALKVQKKGLMQLLLTGIVRVNNDNKQ